MVYYMSKHDREGAGVGSSTDESRERIMYTRSYDILKADDRREMMDFLLWLAFVQKGDMQQFYGVNRSGH